MLPLRAIAARAFGGVLGAICLAGVPAAVAASVELAPTPGVYATPDLAGVAHTVRIAGTIEKGDSDTLRALLMRLTNGRPDKAGLIVAETSGRDGDYYEAMRIGQILRDFRVVTVVRKGEECLSACVLGFLGGSAREYLADGLPAPRRYIEAGATMYFRNYYAKRPRGEPAPNYPVQSLIDYSVRMGVERGFTTRLAALAPDELAHVASVGDFMVIRACPIGLPPATASLAVQATNICTNASQWFDPDAPHTTAPVTAFAAKRLLLEAARQSAYRGKGDRGRDLGQQIAGRTYMDSEEATDRLYRDLRAAGVSLPELSGSIFEVSGYRTGLYRMECLVSFAADNPDKYALLVAAPVSGWLAPMMRELPLSCPELLRHAGNEVINPPRPPD